MRASVKLVFFIYQRLHTDISLCNISLMKEFSRMSPSASLLSRLFSGKSQFHTQSQQIVVAVTRSNLVKFMINSDLPQHDVTKILLVCNVLTDFCEMLDEDVGISL